jgi:hypothetical protein
MKEERKRIHKIHGRIKKHIQNVGKEKRIRDTTRRSRPKCEDIEVENRAKRCRMGLTVPELSPITVFL